LRPSYYLDLCIEALLGKGGYTQDIYVVSHNAEVDKIKKFGGAVKFVYSPSTKPLPTDVYMNNAYMAFEKPYDVMMFLHSDGIVREGWWKPLEELWNEVDTTKIWSIASPTTQPVRGDKKLTIAWDGYNGDYCSRFTTGTSFLCDHYKHTVDKYGINTFYSLEYIMQYEAILAHKWAMMSNNGSFVDHLISGLDSNIMDMNAYMQGTHRFFINTLGYSIGHFMGIWFGRVLITHADEIIENVISGKFDKIDYIFNEALELLNNNSCVGCDIRCTVRNNHRYSRGVK